jgi:hypothetical protein
VLSISLRANNDKWRQIAQVLTAATVPLGVGSGVAAGLAAKGIIGTTGITAGAPLIVIGSAFVGIMLAVFQGYRIYKNTQEEDSDYNKLIRKLRKKAMTEGTEAVKQEKRTHEDQVSLTNKTSYQFMDEPDEISPIIAELVAEGNRFLGRDNMGAFQPRSVESLLLEYKEERAKAIFKKWNLPDDMKTDAHLKWMIVMDGTWWIPKTMATAEVKELKKVLIVATKLVAKMAPDADGHQEEDSVTTTKLKALKTKTCIFLEIKPIQQYKSSLLKWTF